VKRNARHLGLQQAIDHYRSVGGAEVTVASVQYFQIARALRMRPSAIAPEPRCTARRTPRFARADGYRSASFRQQILAYAMGRAASRSQLPGGAQRFRGERMMTYLTASRPRAASPDPCGGPRPGLPRTSAKSARESCRHLFHVALRQELDRCCSTTSRRHDLLSKIGLPDTTGTRRLRNWIRACRNAFAAHGIRQMTYRTVPCELR
jgi:hypothetical protein